MERSLPLHSGFSIIVKNNNLLDNSHLELPLIRTEVLEDNHSFLLGNVVTLLCNSFVPRFTKISFVFYITGSLFLGAFGLSL
jgi:hypothetical protein